MIKYAVINPDGTYAGVPCTSYDEAKDLASQKLGRIIGEIKIISSAACDHIHCPVNGYDCPYFDNGVCTIPDPMENCDDFATVWGEDAQYEDYTCDGGEGCALWERED